MASPEKERGLHRASISSWMRPVFVSSRSAVSASSILLVTTQFSLRTFDATGKKTGALQALALLRHRSFFGLPGEIRSLCVGRVVIVVIVGVLTVKLPTSRAVDDNAQDVVFAKRLQCPGHGIESRGSNPNHEYGSVAHGGQKIRIGCE